MNLQLHREFHSLIEPAEAKLAPAARLSAARTLIASSLVKAIVINIISIILLIGTSG